LTAQGFDQRGALVAQPWSVLARVVVSRLVLNPRIAGLSAYHGEIVGQGQWEPLVPEEAWRAVHGILEDPTRKPSRGVRTLLGGLALCPCGNVVAAQASKDEGVDGVAVNEDPIVGGLCIIQAKRYSKIVGLEAVHALAGVMEDKNAAKGVLVMTSWVGKASHRPGRPYRGPPADPRGEREGRPPRPGRSPPRHAATAGHHRRSKYKRIRSGTRSSAQSRPVTELPSSDSS
jgi:Restriction endonuclease